MVTVIVMVVIVMMDHDHHHHHHDHDHDHDDGGDGDDDDDDGGDDDDNDPNPTPTSTPAPASPFHCPAAVCKVQNETANGQRGCPCTNDFRDFRTNLSQSCGTDISIYIYIYMYNIYIYAMMYVYIHILIWDPIYHFTSTERGQHSGGGKVCTHKFWCLEKLFEIICTICLRNNSSTLFFIIAVVSQQLFQ